MASPSSTSPASAKYRSAASLFPRSLRGRRSRQPTHTLTDEGKKHPAPPACPGGYEACRPRLPEPADTSRTSERALTTRSLSFLTSPLCPLTMIMLRALPLASISIWSSCVRAGRRQWRGRGARQGDSTAVLTISSASSSSIVTRRRVAFRCSASSIANACGQVSSQCTEGTGSGSTDRQPAA